MRKAVTLLVGSLVLLLKKSLGSENRLIAKLRSKALQSNKLKEEDFKLGFELELLEVEEYVNFLMRWMWDNTDLDIIPAEFVNSFAAMQEHQKIHAFMYQSGYIWGMMDNSDDYDY